HLKRCELRAFRRSDHCMRDSFAQTNSPNPHIQRGKDILKAYPQVRALFAPYPLTGLCIAGIVAFQMAMAYALRDASWVWMILAMYLLGAFASHALFVLIHEATHNLIV